jgi:hypothetical protein
MFIMFVRKKIWLNGFLEKIVLAACSELINQVERLLIVGNFRHLHIKLPSLSFSSWFRTKSEHILWTVFANLCCCWLNGNFFYERCSGQDVWNLMK